MTARLVVIRHAEPTRWSSGRAIGRTDVGLSRAGLRHARELAVRLAVSEVDRLVASPALRARRTAGPIGRACLVPVEVDHGIREVDFGELDGRTFASIEREHPDIFAAWMRSPTRVPFPGGERWVSLTARVRTAMDRIARGGAGGTTVVVTHLGPILCTLGRVRSITQDGLFALEVRHGAVFTFEVDGAGSWVELDASGAEIAILR